MPAQMCSAFHIIVSNWRIFSLWIGAPCPMNYARWGTRDWSASRKANSKSF